MGLEIASYYSLLDRAEQNLSSLGQTPFGRSDIVWNNFQVIRSVSQHSHATIFPLALMHRLTFAYKRMVRTMQSVQAA